MSEEASTVQSGQSDGSGSRRLSLSEQPINEATVTEEIAFSRVREFVLGNGGNVYALIVRGRPLVGEEVVESMMLLRVREAAVLVAMINAAVQREGDTLRFVAELGAAMEREKQELPPDGVGDLVDAPVADLAAGRVPTQPDGAT